jgi:DNA (cytosine-5)-methyltransferase 1
MFTFYEFFAGGGMARLGLGSGWRCLLANDLSPKKAAVYLANFPEQRNSFKLCDVAALTPSDLPGSADLAWASFPCQDLSLAGNGAGLGGARSGVFWPFIALIERLNDEGRGPSVVVLENVEGAVTSREGTDFTAIVRALSEGGYLVGAITADAAYFLPQSRSRLFFIAVRRDGMIPSELHYRPTATSEIAKSIWLSDSLISAYEALPRDLRKDWIWWRLPTPLSRSTSLSDILERDEDVSWHKPEATKRMLAMMSETNIEKVRKASLTGGRIVGTVYKRTREGVQRAEVRFDGISGCLRTPRGGSSRQTILLVDGNRIRSRLLSAREAARLMGLPETYLLPEGYNDAYHVAGDGLVVPVVSWLERCLLRPLVAAGRAPSFFPVEVGMDHPEGAVHA